jgi:hypothetical protein
VESLEATDNKLEWDRFVEKSPVGSIFQTTRWLDVACSSKGLRYEIYICRNADKEIDFGVPITYNESRFLRKVTHPPLTPYLGVVHSLDGVGMKYQTYVTRLKERLSQTADLLKYLGAHYVWIRFQPEVADVMPFTQAGFDSEVAYTYLIDLLKSEDELWREFSSERRVNIRKAAKENIVTEETNDASSMPLIEDSFARQNMTPVWLGMAEKIMKMLKPNSRTFLARNSQGEPVAAVFIVWDSKHAYYLLGGVSSKVKHYGAQSLAMWAAIRFSKKMGLQTYDFEGSQIPSIEAYIRQFGGVLTPCYVIKYASPFVKLFLLARNSLRRGL